MKTIDVTDDFINAYHESLKETYKKGYEEGYHAAYKKFHWALFDIVDEYKPGNITVHHRAKKPEFFGKELVIDREFYVEEKA